jgi:hypothetical protein
MARPHYLKFCPATVLAILLTLQAFSAQAREVLPLMLSEHPLPNAVLVHITPRGRELFDKRLSTVLGNLGYNLDEGYFPALTYTFEKPISIDDYAESNPEVVKMYKMTRDMLTKWLVGFSLNDHRPSIEIGESGYTAKFSRFGLVADEDLMRKIGKTEGAVLAIEMEVKKLSIATSIITASDINNPVFGKVGFEDVSLDVGDDDIPLKIRLPFYVKGNGRGGLDFEALTVENNIDKFPISLQYKKLIVPTFAVEVNGKKFLLNNQEFEKLFSDNVPMIISKVRENLGEFATKQLPQMLNEKMKQYLDSQLQTVEDMEAPGQDPGDKRPPLKRGLVLNTINLNKTLDVALNAYVEDPVNIFSEPIKTNGSRGLPALNHLPQDQYDIALAVNRSIINRTIQLSYERGNFEKVKQDDGTILALRAAPLLDYVKTPPRAVLGPQESWVKMRLSVENRPGSMFLKDKIVVSFDAIAKMRPLRDKGGMELVLYKIDTDTNDPQDRVAMDDRYYSWAGSLIKGKVMAEIKDRLRTICADWATKPTVIGELPLPPEIAGLKLDIDKVLVDPTGFVVMYLDYAKGGVK